MARFDYFKLYSPYVPIGILISMVQETKASRKLDKV